MIIKHLIDYKDYLPGNIHLKTSGSMKIDPPILNKPLISIITIVRNAKKTIEKNILSVNNQTYKNYEYIIVDGLSQDGTLEIIKKYNSSITKWISEKDGGALDAINKGIAMSNGEIIFLLSADDWIIKDTLDTIIDGFNVNKNSSFIYGDMTMVSKKKQLTVKGDLDYKAKLKKGLPKFNYPTWAIKKSVYENLGLYTLSFQWNSDYEYLIRTYQNKIEGSYVEKFNVFRSTGGQGESNILISAFDTLRINQIYNLPVFLPSIRIFSDTCAIYFKITLSKIKKLLIN